MSNKSITINYSAVTTCGQEKKWTGLGDGIGLGRNATANYHLREFKADSILIDGEDINKYLETCDKVKDEHADVIVALRGFIEKLKSGAYIAPSKNDVLDRLRTAIGDAICKADQEGYERAIQDQKEQQNEIECRKAYILPSARVKIGSLDGGKVSPVVFKSYIVPSAMYSGKNDAEICDEIMKAQAEVAAESRLEIIDDSPFEPEERARYIAKQMINAALDEHMAKLEGGK